MTTQVVLPLLETDLTEVLMAVADQTLSSLNVTWNKQSALTVVLAAAGYPASPEKGQPIDGVKEANREEG